MCSAPTPDASTPSSGSGATPSAATCRRPHPPATPGDDGPRPDEKTTRAHAAGHPPQTRIDGRPQPDEKTTRAHAAGHPPQTRIDGGPQPEETTLATAAGHRPETRIDGPEAAPSAVQHGPRAAAAPAAAEHKRLGRTGLVREFADAGRQGLDALLAVLLAPGCAVCETVLDAPTRGPVCPACWRGVPRITPPVCDGCGDPLPEALAAVSATRGLETERGPAGRADPETERGPAGAGLETERGPAGRADPETERGPAGRAALETERGPAGRAGPERAGLPPVPRCRRCRRPHVLIRRRRAVGPYEGVLRRLVHVFKYEQRLALAHPLGRLMREAGAGMLADADCAAPVPLHPRRQRARGFNQAAELAARLGLPVVGALRRTRATAPQTALPAAERRRNVGGAFAPARRFGIRPRRADVAGACVVLVDDVTTTGATLDACARVLRRAGAREVRALTLARVVRPARR